MKVQEVATKSIRPVTEKAKASIKEYFGPKVAVDLEDRPALGLLMEFTFDVDLPQ